MYINLNTSIFSHAFINTLWVYNKRTIKLEGDFQYSTLINYQSRKTEQGNFA